MLRHDIGEKKKVGTVSEAHPHLVLDNFTSKLGQRVGNILKYLFPCPKVCSARGCEVSECFPGSVSSSGRITHMIGLLSTWGVQQSTHASRCTLHAQSIKESCN